MITQEQLKSLVHYDPETGIFTWLPRPREMFNHEIPFVCWNARFVGKPIGTKHKSGDLFYLRFKIRIDGRDQFIFCHNAAWLYVTGRYPHGVVDHKNRNSLDNSFSNLRLVNQAINCKNKRMHKNNTSGVNGVSWYDYKRSGKPRWVVKACVNWKSQHIGYFDDLFEAICARKSFDAKHGFTEDHGKA